MLAAGGVAYWVTRRRAAAAGRRRHRSCRSRSAKRRRSKPPKIPFTDITAAAGITFVHQNAATGEKLLPGDDGRRLRVFRLRQRRRSGSAARERPEPWPWDRPAPPDDAKPTSALYRNDGQGQFDDVTAGSGLDVSIYGMGVAVGDYDSDGRCDVFVSAVGRNRLFHNDGNGKFRDVTAEAGVAGATTTGAPAAAGSTTTRRRPRPVRLQLRRVVARERRSRRTSSSPAAAARTAGRRTSRARSRTCIATTATASFTDVTEAAGLQMRNPATNVPVAKSLGVTFADVDRDGWIDIVVANDTVQNFLFHNQRRRHVSGDRRVRASPSTWTATPAGRWASTPRGSATTSRWASPSATSPTR